MNILMIGDVVSKPGRLAVLERIQDLREQHQVDLAIMNAENLAGGFSVTPSLCEGLFSSGIDVMTSGNHIWDKREIYDYLPREPRLLRPGNYVSSLPGTGLYMGKARNGVPYRGRLRIGLPVWYWFRGVLVWHRFGNSVQVARRRNSLFT